MRAILISLLFAVLLETIAANSGITVQFYFHKNADGTCNKFPVAFDWWAGKALLGNFTNNYVGTCSLWELAVIDSTNGRTFYYASGTSTNNYTSTISTFTHRASDGTVTVPTMVHQANTLFLERPDACVYDPVNDRLILVDTYFPVTVYALDYTTGALTKLLSDYSFNFACLSPVLSGTSLYCTWDSLYQMNLATGIVTTYPIYPPIVHQSTIWEEAVGIAGVANTDLYYIYWNPQTELYANFVIDTANCSIITPFDSNQTIFGGFVANDEMNSFDLYSIQQGGNSEVYAAVVRGGANSFYPSYVKIFQLDTTNNNTLHEIGTSPTIAPFASANTLANGGMMWDGFTKSQSNK